MDKRKQHVMPVKVRLTEDDYERLLSLSEQTQIPPAVLAREATIRYLRLLVGSSLSDFAENRRDA